MSALYNRSTQWGNLSIRAYDFGYSDAITKPRGHMPFFNYFKLTVLFIFTGTSIHNYARKPAATPVDLTTQLADMTLSEKIGQLLMVHFRGTTANAAARCAVQELAVGGIIYYNWANDLSNPAQVQALGADLQQLAQQTRHKIPLLIAADQEGGLVERCPITKFPGNKALGLTQQPALAAASAQAIGSELAVLNVNTNLAPVVDVNNPGNPVIGIRAFGDQPELVTTYAQAALQGYHTAGMITTLKHFPGHGDTLTDSHYDQPVVNKTLAELEKVDLYPFAQLAAQTDMIMTAHINVPALDPAHCSTLSRKTLDYLRQQIGFQGVVITDSLVMAGVLKPFDGVVAEAAIQALAAGHDLVLLGGAQLHGADITKELTLADVAQIKEAIMAAVESGRLSLTQIDQSVSRVLKLKQQYFTQVPQRAQLENLINTPAHQALAVEIAQTALLAHQQAQHTKFMACPFAEQNVLIVAPQLLQPTLAQTELAHLGRTTTVWTFSGLNPSATEIATAQAQAQTADTVLVCAYNAWKNAQQQQLIKTLP